MYGEGPETEHQTLTDADERLTVMNVRLQWQMYLVDQLILLILHKEMQCSAVLTVRVRAQGRIV
jgi:hypothetical protein